MQQGSGHNRAGCRCRGVVGRRDKAAVITEQAAAGSWAGAPRQLRRWQAVRGRGHNRAGHHCGWVVGRRTEAAVITEQAAAVAGSMGILGKFGTKTRRGETGHRKKKDEDNDSCPRNDWR